eukprot:scpid36909/ scgid19232/ 
MPRPPDTLFPECFVPSLARLLVKDKCKLSGRRLALSTNPSDLVCLKENALPVVLIGLLEIPSPYGARRSRRLLRLFMRDVGDVGEADELVLPEVCFILTKGLNRTSSVSVILLYYCSIFQVVHWSGDQFGLRWKAVDISYRPILLQHKRHHH